MTIRTGFQHLQSVKLWRLENAANCGGNTFRRETQTVWGTQWCSQAKQDYHLSGQIQVPQSLLLAGCVQKKLRELSRRPSNQMPQQPQLTPFWCEGAAALHHIWIIVINESSKAEFSYPAEETDFSCFVLVLTSQLYGESWNRDITVNWEFCVLAQLLHHKTTQNP